MSNIILDSEGTEVRAGDAIHFAYGIPGMPVRADVIERDGKLIALTPDNNPDECPVSELKKYIGYFTVSPTPTIALSVRQPWAWAIIHAGKHIENRSSLSLCKRGLKLKKFSIHASKNMTCDDYQNAKLFMKTLKIRAPEPYQLTRGAIIGHVQCIDTISQPDSKWFMGPHGMVLQCPTKIKPIPVKGQLGFFKWTATGQIEQPKPWMKSYSAIRGEEE